MEKRSEEVEQAATGHKRIEEELKKSEERFRKIFEHSNDAIFLVDAEQDEILEVNLKACSMLGYSREELLSVPMSVIHPHEMKKLRSFAQSVYKEGKGWTNELTCLTKSKKTLSAEISASILDLSGRKCMIALIRDTSERNRLEHENKYLVDEIRTEGGFGEIIGSSPPLRKVLEQIEMVAPTDANVLITGESGTGKELVARVIHERSKRVERALVRVNCASIPGELFESEFFGHVKGAFTSAVENRQGRFELADGGTIFLDEVGEIPLKLQGKLLRVLQEGQFERVGESRTRKVDVRIIAASNRDLRSESKFKRFRQDLYYRLSVFPIEVPPLRNRGEDIAPLAEHFLHQSCKRLKISHPRLTREDLRKLEKYPWPGNIRELQNVIERASILAGGGRLRFDLEGSGETTDDSTPLEPTHFKPREELTLEDLKNLERDIIVHALEQADWKVHGSNGAAARLGLKPTTLASRVKKMGIQRPPLSQAIKKN